MKRVLALTAGFLLAVAPLWFLSGMMPVPEYRTGTLSDFTLPLAIGLTLYGGVLVGALVDRRLTAKRHSAATFWRVFFAGMAGAMVAIALAVSASFLIEWVSTGRAMRQGQTLALLPIPFIVGGIVSAPIAAAAGLFTYALNGPRD